MENSDANKVLSTEECEKFYTDWDNEETKKKFFEHNIPLAKYIANKYWNTGIEYDELFQIACIGLWKAVKNFEPNKGALFGTYAYRIMDNEIRMLLRQIKRQPLIDNKRILSLDTSLNFESDGDTLTLEDVLASSDLELDNDIIGRELYNLIQSFMDNYNPRSVHIMKLYMSGMSQLLIADQIGISRSRISRITCKFKSDLMKYLHEYYDKDL